MSSIILLNKPFQVLSQFTDGDGRSTLAEFLTIKNVYPAGRLDYDSEGLLILTDDGQLQHQISNPRAKMEKTYWAQVEGLPSDSDLEPLRKGISLKDGPCLGACAKLIDAPVVWDRQPPIRIRRDSPTRWIELTIREGRNRQVRRMTAAIGFPTLRLIRIRIGDWSVAALAPGEFRQMTVHGASRPARTTPKRFKRASNGRSRL
jgi:23S rRNA pseudouridine2457 synthase